MFSLLIWQQHVALSIHPIARVQQQYIIATKIPKMYECALGQCVCAERYNIDRTLKRILR